ncbi:MerR family transcriptional regulator [Cereibacter sphaeroides]|uniref:MerR family transcriptional regulator n=1 Tax=Cereibacter sphaeroides TaxID=1063 RepID=UPI001F24D5ED|nr:MerR family transcriptional regulator [Cereibacter sphaeroides]MCE6960564.1 MerR family transcriptional regulator [Cereibacter sphaeroides]MCE6972755.1 MerR family transcriptional regulator [Cereibacter sphaeroides]
MILDTITFSASQVSELTGVSNDNIQNWIKRKLIVGHREIKGGGSQGRHRRFTFHNVMEIALIAALSEAGLSASDAARAAPMFAHTSGGGTFEDTPARDPGLPFHFKHGWTYFAVGRERTTEELWKPGEEYDTFGRIIEKVGEAFTVVNVTRIFDLVCARLQAMTGEMQTFHPSKLLDEAYPEDARG